MKSTQKINVAVVGLGFGAEFVPIYLDHPGVKSLSICDGDLNRLQEVGDKFFITNRFRDFREVIDADNIDAVHLVTGIPDHAWQAVDVLVSGKHCASTVPMATSLKDLNLIVSAQKQAGKNYMMMETAVYTRQFLHVQALLEKGVFGRIQFLRGALYNDMEGWPGYWAGLPPMWYATHALNPLLALARTRATKVHCLGSGSMRVQLQEKYRNPFPIETATFQLAQPGLAAEVTVGLFHNARPYIESLVVYGENACYEWQMEDDPPVLFSTGPVIENRRRMVTITRPIPPDRMDLLPPPIEKHTRRMVYASPNGKSFEHGVGHHGSHPHLVHEFVSSIIEGRPPAIDAVTAANWTAAGLCAHESAMRGGEGIEVPDFNTRGMEQAPVFWAQG